MEFKDRIKARRLDLGLTLDDVAKLVGVSNPTISRWESGAIVNQRRDKIELLAKALRMTPGELMGWASELPAVNNTVSVFLSPAEKSLVESYRHAPLEIRAIVDTALAPYSPQNASTTDKAM